MKKNGFCFTSKARSGNISLQENVEIFPYFHISLLLAYIERTKIIITRDAFQAAKIRKEGFRKYVMFGPNHILVTLRWDEGRSPGQENVCRWFLNRYTNN